MYRFISFLIIIISLFPVCLEAQVNDLPRSTPEAEGIKSLAVSKMFATLTSLPNTDIHHVMILRHGKVVAELHPYPYKAIYGHAIYSCSKSYVSMAIGIAIEENRLRLTDRVASFFPGQLPDTISSNLAAMTIRNLLTMTSGILPDWEMRNYKSNWIESYLSKPVNSPGKNFYYDSMSTFLLSAIIQKVTGMKTLDYLKSRLFTPMNITEVGWEESPDGINTGGWGLHLQCESQAKFGLLLLNDGYWKGNRLIPTEWIKEAAAKQVNNLQNTANLKPTDSNQGYGYQLWRCKYPGAFRIDGALGQFTVIIPDKDMVVVINGNCIGETYNQLNAIWDILIPGVTGLPMKPGKEYDNLLKLCKNSCLKTPAGKKDSNISGKVTGRNIILQDNKHGIRSLMIENSGNSYILHVSEKNGKKYTIPFNYNNWSCFTTDNQPPYSINALSRFKGLAGNYNVAGAYAWTGRNTLELKAHYVNWISSRRFLFDFNGNNARITISDNFTLNSKESINAVLE